MNISICNSVGRREKRWKVFGALGVVDVAELDSSTGDGVVMSMVTV